MRVLNIMLGEKQGGLEQAALDYAEALTSKGHDVTMVVRKGSWAEQTARLNRLAVLPIVFPYIWNPLAARKIARAAREADILILHGNRAGKLTMGLKTGVRIVPVVHSRFFRVRSHFSALIAASKAMEEKHRASGLPVHVVYNAVRLPPEEVRPPFRMVPVAGAFGRLSPEKGMDIFIDAIAHLRACGIPINGVIGGGGPEEESLRRKVEYLGLQDCVRFVGWVKDKRAFFSGIDVFCLSSRTETFPITLLEAMGHGVPCVATRCGGPSEIIEDGVTGVLADIDAEDLAARIQEMFEAPDKTAEMGLAGRAVIRESYDLPVLADRLDGILNEKAISDKSLS